MAKLLRKRDVAEQLGVSEKTVSRLISEGDLPSVRVGKRSVRVDPDQLRQVIDRGGRKEESR